jgi:exodeoxyribonuclease VIII
MSKQHVMVDIETLGRGPYAPVVSIGAVAFDPDVSGDNIGSTFHRKMTFKAASYQRVPDQSTLDWWAKQPAEAQAALLIDQIDDVAGVLTEFCEWFPEGAFVWGNGPTFDITILETLFQPRAFHTRRSISKSCVESRFKLTFSSTIKF